MMDTRQRVVKKTFTKEQLEGMSLDDVVALVGEAGPNATFTGTAVVRKANGSIRYDKDAVPGSFNESPEDMARIDKETT